jgi:hypothetical protein
MEIETELPNLCTSNEKSINEIEICIDILIILSNSDFSIRKPEFMKEELKRTIAFAVLTQIAEESKDKLSVLEAFCFS